MKRWIFPLGFVLTAACQGSPSTQQSADSTVPAAVTSAGAGVAPVVLKERDTVTIYGKLYDIVDIEQVEFDEVPGWVWEANKEEESIKKYADKVSRRGDTLFLKLDDGSYKSMVSNMSDNDDNREYEFCGYMPALKSYLVYCGMYEDFDYQLVQTAGGGITTVIGVPQLSPDEDAFICSNMDLAAGFFTNGFELYSVTGNKFEELQLRMPETWGPVIIKWKDEKSFVAHLKELDPQMQEINRYVKFVPR
ncbi:hypothetical protein [Chitinophaga barathri]|uniref:Lipoprotein n=1 Tax=Chitinophaga barathri TaxID=1647451 RepID=A0A3N4MSB9_9BACT|nr:hypothetical protein [Chitinophaga barathri]RPD38293.1 hypothetical protein EG028_25720 [Chitinophaga barathri]